MRLLRTILLLVPLLAVSPARAAGREELKVSMEDVLKEISNMRRELRELKIQRDRDQRVIEDLRRIVEYGIHAQSQDAPRPAASPAGSLKMRRLRLLAVFQATSPGRCGCE